MKHPTKTWKRDLFLLSTLVAVITANAPLHAGPSGIIRWIEKLCWCDVPFVGAWLHAWWTSHG